MPEIKSPKKLCSDRTILVALIVVIAIKAVALFTGLYACDGDEAIIGIMARHILAGKGHPVYMYGQSYGAGAGLEAHLAAGIMAITGKTNVLAVKLAATMIFGAFLFTLWITVKRFWDKPAANIALLLAAASPTMTIWFSKLRGGHITALVITLAALRIALDLLPSEESKQISHRGGFFILGVLSAAAAWCQPLAAAPPVILLAVVLAAKARRIFFSGEIFLMLLGILVIAIPLIMAMPEKTAWSVSNAGVSMPEIANVWTALKEAPGLFEPFLDGISPSSPLWIKLIGWLWLVIFFLAFAALLKTALKRLEPSSRFKLILVLLAPISVLVVSFGVSPESIAPRHFIAAYPFCCLMMGVFLSEGNKNPGRGSIFAKLLTILLVASVFVINLKFIGPATIYGAGTQVRPMPAQEVTMLIRLLDSRGVRYAYCLDYMLKWNIVFESDERIITSGLSAADRYQPYVDAVNSAASNGELVPLIARFPIKSKTWEQFETMVMTNPDNATKIGDEIFIVWRPAP